MTRERWVALFADFEAQLDGAEARELDDVVLDRLRLEHARISLADRLAAQRGADVGVTTAGAGVVRGRLADAGKDWLLVGDTLVPRTAVLAIEGLDHRAQDPDATRLRLPFGAALRAIAAEHDAVTCTFVDGTTVRARITRVGKDAVDLDGRVVPFRAIAALRPAPPG